MIAVKASDNTAVYTDDGPIPAKPLSKKGYQLFRLVIVAVSIIALCLSLGAVPSHGSNNPTVSSDLLLTLLWAALGLMCSFYCFSSLHTRNFVDKNYYAWSMLLWGTVCLIAAIAWLITTILAL